MTGFRSMGCDVETSGFSSDVRALFDERDRRFSRFQDDSELSLVNRSTKGVMRVSAEFAAMTKLALSVGAATSGLVTPTGGAALVAAGYDRDFDDLPADGVAPIPARVPPLSAVALRGTLLLRTEPTVLDLNGVVKGRTVDDALALVGSGWISAGGDVATRTRITVGLPGGATVTLHQGGLATSSVTRRSWSRGGERQHHLIDPQTGRPADVPWSDVSVAAGSCLAADIAAKAALLLGPAGPAWLDRRGLAGRFRRHTGGVVVNETWRALAGTA